MGEPSVGLPEGIGAGTESVDDEAVVLWHTFGLTHIPSPEDVPIMPVTRLLRPRIFSAGNAVMDVPKLRDHPEPGCNGEGRLGGPEGQAGRAGHDERDGRTHDWDEWACQVRSWAT